MNEIYSEENVGIVIFLGVSFLRKCVCMSRIMVVKTEQ